MRNLARLLTVLLIGWSSTPALGVLVIDPPVSLTAPADDPGFANVGNRGVYIGDGWVLTAWHTGIPTPGVGTITFPMLPSGSNQFSIIAGSATRLNNPATFGGHSLTSVTDLLMYRLDGTPALPSLVIPSSAPSAGDAIVLVGDGLGKGSATTWTGGGTTHHGFNGTGSPMIWGTNNVTDFGGGQIYSLADSGSGQVISYVTTFDDIGGTEATALSGDSGGGAFRKNGGTWELSGIIHAVDPVVDEPGVPSAATVALYGNQTYVAELSQYSTQINQIRATAVPEPSAPLLLAVVGIVAGLQRWLRRPVSGTKLGNA